MAPVQTTIGYYRYTDILWEWHKLIPDPAEASALKAFITNDSLVDPNNPLRRAGVNGVELFMGTMPTGQARLLFSSAQVEYIRYWLHAMGFTKGLLPIPSSDILLTESTLRNCAPVIYTTSAELKKAVRVIDKNNKKLKGADTGLMSLRIGFERVRNLWGSKKGTWIAMDFEAWERDHTVITEFGWCSMRWVDGNEVMEDGHLIVKEHYSYRNGTYVSDCKDRYKFGTSQKVTKAVFRQKICSLITDAAANGPVFLIFHDSSQDIKYLRSKFIDAPLTGLLYLLPDEPPKTGLFAVDTAELFSALEGESNNRRGLGRVCTLLKINTECLHNAGNDAHYCLLSLQAMASGNQLDIQREERWPNHTESKEDSTPSVKVQFQEYEYDSEFSDIEGVIIDAPIASDETATA